MRGGFGECPGAGIREVVLGTLTLVMVLLGASTANALSNVLPGDFTLSLSDRDFAAGGILPEFSRVTRFRFELDFAGPLAGDGDYDNDDLLEARYVVRGPLSLSPPTPSGFSAFLLNRTETGEGPIPGSDWAEQNSRVAFKIARDAELLDGLQLDELVALGKEGRILEISAREHGREDRARYHPPQLLLYADGTGLLWNADNSSKDTGTVNPATLQEVFVDYGDEYITRLDFDPSQITIVAARDLPPVPEPGSALLIGLGLAGLGALRPRRG